MATQDNQQTNDRNDPAIDPDTPDNHMGQDKTPGQAQGGRNQDGSQSQSNNGAQSQENNGNQSGENSFTPDFEPHEHKSPDTTSEQTETGETDGDIDTQGG
ncbi:hypothetical protein [Pseudomonas sp.]|uniref:hypothetical protein n=1 Tax=Pseudomonas sp. TaxID=306 RepID=UPI0028AFCD13|nr:hypothetical protein [Pseudomonas sp.]